MFELHIHKRAKKYLTKLPKQKQRLIHQKFIILSHNPFDTQLDTKRYIGAESSYRLRAGNLRIIFQLNLENNTIGHRGDVYK